MRLTEPQHVDRHRRGIYIPPTLFPFVSRLDVIARHLFSNHYWAVSVYEPVSIEQCVFLKTTRSMYQPSMITYHCRLVSGMEKYVT